MAWPPPFVTWAQGFSTQTVGEDLFLVFTQFWAGKWTDFGWKNFYKFSDFFGPPPPIRKSCVRYCWWWILNCGVRTRKKLAKLELAQANSLRPTKARKSKLKIKLMVICFMDSTWISNIKCVSPNQTVNQHFHLEALKRLRKRVSCVRPQIQEKLMQHHDNALCRTHSLVNHRLFGLAVLWKVGEWFATP